MGEQPQEAKAKDQQAQQCPANKSQMQVEQIHLISLHHGRASFDSSIVGSFRFVFENVGNQGIRVGFDDSGYDQQ